MAAQLLPLFPLSVVLLPATPLPLHIFEDRYKEMMSEVIAEDSEFGVVLVKEQGIVNLGCSAKVQKVFQRYPDGRLDLLTVGQRRFQVVALDQEKSYLRASVEFFGDEDPEKASLDLRKKALDAYAQLRDVEHLDVLFEPDLNSGSLSFQLAQFIVDLDKRQTVLSLRSEEERLQFLIQILPEYIEHRERLILAKQVAPLNGHAKHIRG